MAEKWAKGWHFRLRLLQTFSSSAHFCPRKNAKKGSPARLCSFWQQKQLFIIFICITRIVVSLLFLVIYISQVFVYSIFRDSLRPKQEASIYVIFFFFEYSLNFCGISGYSCLLIWRLSFNFRFGSMCWVYLYLWSACFYHVDNGQFSITWFSSYNLWTLRIAILFSGFTQRNVEYRCSFRVLVKKRLLLLRLAFFWPGGAHLQAAGDGKSERKTKENPSSPAVSERTSWLKLCGATGAAAAPHEPTSPQFHEFTNPTNSQRRTHRKHSQCQLP